LLDSRAVGAGQQAFVVERADLLLKGASCPALTGAFPHVPLARLVVVNPQEGPIVGSTQVRDAARRELERREKTLALCLKLVVSKPSPNSAVSTSAKAGSSRFP
jgi:hypothetical protein